jgi:hypothetical protein
MHGNELVKPRVVHVLVAELETRWRLHVDELQVGRVGEDQQRAPLPRRSVGGPGGQLRANNAGLSRPDRDGPVGTR